MKKSKKGSIHQHIQLQRFKEEFSQLIFQIKETNWSLGLQKACSPNSTLP